MLKLHQHYLFWADINCVLGAIELTGVELEKIKEDLPLGLGYFVFIDLTDGPLDLDMFSLVPGNDRI